MYPISSERLPTPDRGLPPLRPASFPHGDPLGRRPLPDRGAGPAGPERDLTSVRQVMYTSCAWA